MGHLRGNVAIVNNHFRKEWQNRVKTWFDQPMKKMARRRARGAKAAKVHPRPRESLRPSVHCPTNRYNYKLRLGRGFTALECKKAGVKPRFARTVGIAIDYRRRNYSKESVVRNAERLKEYLGKLILYPRNPAKPIGMEAKKVSKRALKYVQSDIQPVYNNNKAFEGVRRITRSEKNYHAYRMLRHARNELKVKGWFARQAKANAKYALEKTKKDDKKGAGGDE